MSDIYTLYPRKKIELENFWFDSKLWNHFQYRDNDIIIDTFPKCGTTWMQQIVGQLIFNGSESINVKDVSPWLDFRFNKDKYGSNEKVLEILEQQTHRRFIKSHLPFDALLFSSKAKYIFVARDGRDVACSIYNHRINGTSEGVVKPNSVNELFESNIVAQSETSFFTYIKSWWNMRHLPNILLVHYYQLKKDLPNEIKRIATFLNIDIDPLRWNDILEHCSFNYMKTNADKMVEKEQFLGGAKSFFCQGTNDRWKGILTDEDSEIYLQRAREELDEEGTRWILTGELNG
ncbi:hypothetical protein I4U23_015589 [Adineta vaga]|nr:hypothetical protein I4U23_015589 [Adineta vaga]